MVTANVLAEPMIILSWDESLRKSQPSHHLLHPRPIAIEKWHCQTQCLDLEVKHA